MQLEEYFDFIASDDIRIRGTRVGIETILYEYIYREQQPSGIKDKFPTLTLEQIYATILYYLHNRQKVDEYIADWLKWSKKVRKEQKRNPPPVLIKLSKLKNDYKQAVVHE